MQGSPSKASLDDGLVDNLFSNGNLCGPIAATVNETMFYLVFSKWREAFDSLKETHDYKSLSAAGSLMKNMIHMLGLVLKLLPEDSKEPQTARILLYKLFYDQTDQGLTHFLMNLFRCFDSHKQPKSDLADLLEIIHIVFRLMEKLQSRGTLRVAKKSRKGRRTKKGSGEVKSDKSKDEHPSPQNDIEKANEPEQRTSEPFLDTNNTSDNLSESISAQKEGTSTSNQDLHADKDNVTPIDGDKENNPNDQTYGTENSSDGDQMPATSEVDFNVTRLVSSFANNSVIENLCWLLKYYQSNSASTNHYVVCMLRRVCDDLELSPMLYQLSLLNTFYGILSEQKLSRSKDYAHIIHFITKFVRKMMKTMKRQPLLFVEILFWKTRKECHYINAEAIMGDLTKIKKDIRTLENERTAFSNCRGAGYRSIADSIGDDEVENVLPHILNSQGEAKLSDTIHQEILDKERRSEHKSNINISTDDMDEDKSESNTDLPSQRTSRMRKGSIFDAEQETAIIQLYEKYKNDRRCSRLIAEALDPDGNISPVQVSSKLKKLGLKLASRKRSTSTGMHIPAGEDTDELVHITPTTDATNESDDGSYMKTLRRRERISTLSKEQELEVKLLFERFKDQKKCSQLIANALGSDNAYTAAQVSRKLRQLGLLAPQAKRLSKSAKHTGDKETIGSKDESEEETLQALKERSKRKKSKPQTQEAMAASMSPQDTVDEFLNTTLRDELVPHKDGHEEDAFAALADATKVEIDNTSKREDKTHDELMIELEDSGDDLGTVVSRMIGSRRNL